MTFVAVTLLICSFVDIPIDKDYSTLVFTCDARSINKKENYIKASDIKEFHSVYFSYQTSNKVWHHNTEACRVVLPTKAIIVEETCKTLNKEIESNQKGKR